MHQQHATCSNMPPTKFTDFTRRRMRDAVKQKKRREENTIDNNGYQFQKRILFEINSFIASN